MEIIDTFRKALKLQIHTLLFIFPTKKFKTLQLSRNCLSTLQFSFWHTFPPPQLWRVFFPAPNKETGSHGRDFATQISCSLGSSEGSQGLTQARHTQVLVYSLAGEGGTSQSWAPWVRQDALHGCCPLHPLGVFPQSWYKTGAQLQAVPPQSPSLDTCDHAFCCDFSDHAEQPDIKAPWDPFNFLGTESAPSANKQWSQSSLHQVPHGMWNAGPRCEMQDTGHRMWDAGCCLPHSAARGGAKQHTPKCLSH